MFLDVGVGILTAIFASYFFSVDLSLWLVIFGILCALLPDADFLYFYPKRHDTKYDHKHRDIIHYPLLFLPVGTILIFLFFGKIWQRYFLLRLFCILFMTASVLVGV
jgi:hypothetical protein